MPEDWQILFDQVQVEGVRRDLERMKRENAIRCLNCGVEIENRGVPSMSGPGRDHWVHIPEGAGGYTACDPQQGANSPQAIPSFNNGNYVPSGYVTWDQLRATLGFTPDEEIMTADRARRFTEQVNENRSSYTEKDRER